MAVGKALPRRTILVGAGALVLPVMSGCGSLAPENIQARHQIEKSLKSFHAVKSVNVELDSNFTAGDSWSVLILLNKILGEKRLLPSLKAVMIGLCRWWRMTLPVCRHHGCRTGPLCRGRSQRMSRMGQNSII